MLVQYPSLIWENLFGLNCIVFLLSNKTVNSSSLQLIRVPKSPLLIPRSLLVLVNIIREFWLNFCVFSSKLLKEVDFFDIIYVFWSKVPFVWSISNIVLLIRSTSLFFGVIISLSLYFEVK